MTTVRITNTYACGRTSTDTVEVPTPRGRLDWWWDNEVFPDTGDGHECASTERAHYRAEIIESPREDLIGKFEEWEG